MCVCVCVGVCPHKNKNNNIILAIVYKYHTIHCYWLSLASVLLIIFREINRSRI